MLPNILVVIYCQQTTQEQRPVDNSVINKSTNNTNIYFSNISNRYSNSNSSSSCSNDIGHCQHHNVNNVSDGHASIKYENCAGRACLVCGWILSVLTSLPRLQQALSTHPDSVTTEQLSQQIEQQKHIKQQQQQFCRTLTNRIKPTITLPLSLHFRHLHLHIDIIDRWRRRPVVRAIELYANVKKTVKYWKQKFANIIRKYEFNYCCHCATNGPQGIHGKSNTNKITR
ncbi:uncharacterized protein LOC118738127 [Rhagoletis pomonella]|uniref:uncharacterized protein LOC118738127 n=1 Tax=Rhagoletis pomonella TaxID=28610 RepID=UPI0017810DFF|nr:uncharacterized protein LOC118738127 [Rhagoletis pomonella]